MGGSNSMFQMFGFGPQQQQQFSPTQYTNDQMLDYARSNNTNFDELNKYQNEIINQLKGNSYQDPYKVWQAVRNGNDRSAFEKAQQDVMSSLLSSSQSDQQSGV